MRRSGKIALYPVFAVLVVLFFLYALFPSQLLRNFIVAQLSRKVPGLELNTAKVSPVLPLGLRLTPISISYQGMEILVSDHLTARLVVSSIFKSSRQIKFSTPVGGGRVDGNSDWHTTSENALNNLFVHVSDVPLEALAFLNCRDEYKPFGRLNAYIDFDRRRGGAGSTLIRANLYGSGLTFNPPLMGLTRVEFNQAQSEMNLTQRMLQIKQFEASGPQISGRLMGSVLLRQPLEQSRLTLSCMLKPEPTFFTEHKNDALGTLPGGDVARKRGFFIRISGTPANPNYLVR